MSGNKIALKNPIAVKLGRAIEARRKTRKISQEKLAEMADVSRAYMGCVERGEYSASLQTLARVAKALKWTLADMFLSADL